MWWPLASYERLKTCTFWTVFLFTIDDDVDQSTAKLSKNLEAANRVRNQLYHFIRYILGVPDKETLEWKFDENPPCPLIQSLEPIGASLLSFYNQDQILIFVNEVLYFVNSQQQEQARRLGGIIPSVEEFWETRLGSSAVTTALALNE